MNVSSFGYPSVFRENGPYQKVALNELQSAPMFPIVHGIVIGKCDSKFVATKKGGDRYVFNFTIRDSPSDVVNAACWGDEAQVKAVSEAFAIGDVVQIKNPQIVMKEPDSNDEKYRPYTSSRYELVVSPRNSELTVCSGATADEYTSFLHCCMHSANDYLVLADVIYNHENIEGYTVNLLVSVKKIGAVQILKAKDGRPLKKLEIEVFDQSHSSFPILIWDGQIAQFIINYLAPKSILLISDIRINFSRYTNGMMATAVSCTIFTPEPTVPDARVLYQYVQTVQLEDLSSASKGNSEVQIYTVDQVKQILALCEFSTFRDTEGILFAFISSFDIDGNRRAVSVRCPECKHAIRTSGGRCINGNCEVGAGMKALNPEDVFDVRINLTDHTGTLTRCHMYGGVVQNLFNCTVSEFVNLSEAEKSVLKWQFLLENFKFEFKIPHGPASLGNPIVRITSCTPATPAEVASFYKSLL